MYCHTSQQTYKQDEAQHTLSACCQTAATGTYIESRGPHLGFEQYAHVSMHQANRCSVPPPILLHLHLLVFRNGRYITDSLNLWSTKNYGVYNTVANRRQVL